MDSDWRKEALAKFFNASFVHVDSEGARMTLREQVDDVLIQLDHNYTLPEARDRIIAAFGDALLSNEVVEVARVAYDDAFTEHLMSTRAGWHATRAALHSALAVVRQAKEVGNE